MPNKAKLVPLLLSLCLSAAGGAAIIPDALNPPPGQTLAFTANARGAQIYECKQAHDDYVWTFVAPEADLFDSNGNNIGHHFAGPTWQSTDGSTVVGKVTAKQDAPDSKDVAWLLINVSSHDGSGVMTDITWIQRIDTQGGMAPAEGCSAAHVGETFNATYTATYAFYHQQAMPTNSKKAKR